MTDPRYQELRDAGYEEMHLEQRIGEGWTLSMLRDQAVIDGFLLPLGSGDFSIGGNLWPGLSKLAEEAGEIGQVIGKIIGNEGREDHWDGSHLPTRLTEEMGDLLAAMRFVVLHNAGLDWQAVMKRSDAKIELFEKWHRDTLDRKAAA